MKEMKIDLTRQHWDELQHRLASRDALAKNPQATIEDVIKLEGKYHKEFKTHGLRRLRIYGLK